MEDSGPDQRMIHTHCGYLVATSLGVTMYNDEQTSRYHAQQKFTRIL